MSDFRTPEQRLSDEAARWRKSYREASAALEDANRMLLGVYLRERLTDPTDFEMYVGLAAVVDQRGAIVWTRVNTLLRELLASKPHLAAPLSADPSRSALSAVQWLATET